DGVSPTGPHPNITGGQLVFQLGSISEDVARDGKHAFENGLPPNGDLVTGAAAENTWGYVTTQQYLTSSFDNSGTARANQDVGLDGLPTEKEIVKFSDYLTAVFNNAGSEVFEKVRADPSSDNFAHFLDTKYDQGDAQLLERYKDYNGQDGNSPIIT